MKSANELPLKPPRMLSEERRRDILMLLERQRRVTVEDLTRRFGVSAVTARADLDALSASGALVRSHGGAVPPLNPGEDYPLTFKETLHQAEKVRIGRAAVGLIQPNQTVILDSGTTAAQVAAHLRRTRIEGLTVITHALNIAVSLVGAPGISLVVVGGITRPISSSCVGPQAERMIRDMHADHFFLSVDGIDLDSGLSTPDILEAQLNALMTRAARQVTVIADASKFGRRSLSVIGGLECVHRVITDGRVAPEFTAALKDHGIEVLVV